MLGDRYTLKRKVQGGDAKRGLPELWEADDIGDRYYVKLWRRSGESAFDIRALWNREVRSLMRVQGFPQSSEIFVKLHDLREEKKFYYAVLNVDQREPLAEALEKRSRRSALQNLYETPRRRALWEGLLRVARGLVLLHGEGTLHRSLTPWSVFVGYDDGSDFRLSGFEWSLRLSGADGASITVSRPSGLVAPEVDPATASSGEYSVATDWYDFGLLAAEIFGVPLRNLKKRAAVVDSLLKLQPLRERERALIRHLLMEDQRHRLVDGDEICNQIRGLITELNVTSTAINRNLILAVRLGPDVRLSKAIAEASERRASADRVDEQKRWMEADLQGDLRITLRPSTEPYFILRGERLEYRVQRFRTGDLSTWDIGFCDSAENFPKPSADDQVFSLGQRQLELVSWIDAKRSIQRIRDRSAPWDRAFPIARERRQLEPHLRDVRDFFRITQALDALFIAASICPVEVVIVDRTDAETTIEVTPFEEPERNELAQVLSLGPPSEQLRDWFGLGFEAIVEGEDSDRRADQYQLLGRRSLESEGSRTRWQFRKASFDESGRGVRYQFTAPVVDPVRERRYYLARNHDGTLSQLRRRNRFIEELQTQESLLRTLADLAATSRLSSDSLPPARAPIKLDDSKLTVLERIWRTQPFFALQGPPGTGKTTLVKAFLDRLLAHDPSAQILLTAHSHHTVDDVLGKIADLFRDHPSANPPLLLRVRSGDGARNGKETKLDNATFEVEPVTERLLAHLRTSILAGRSPPFLRGRLDAAITGADGGQVDTDLRTMQLLVQDAANITFSTLNSAGLSDIAARSRRFDWSVIEEAGKAHGFDMVVAMGESHRLLMIGDHKQLFPFNAQVFKTLLGEPLRVRKAIEKGQQFAVTLVDPTIVADDPTRAPLEERCTRWRAMVGLFGWLFEQVSSLDPESSPVATLTDQHRMHPAIARLVGRTFYPSADSDGETFLRSPSEIAGSATEQPPFRIRTGSWLPAEAVVWCDVPWVQDRRFSKGEEDGFFISTPEIKAVLKILLEIRSRGSTPCSIQILSPYNDQLKELRSAIRLHRADPDYAHMFSDPLDLTVGKRMGATVDDFQGSEADVVIVSLVRNNAEPPSKSLGFLRVPNRMNVLLSRAKHKLIIVGSWKFFASRCDEFTGPDVDYVYLRDLTKAVKRAMSDGELYMVDMVK